MNEVWKDIPGYEGLFCVSNTGKVKRLDGFFIQPLRNGTTRRGIIKEKLLKYWMSAGYRNVKLWHQGKVKSISIHRLVLFAFAGQPPEGKPHGLHLNHNKVDNRPENLIWGSPQENMQMDWADNRRTAYSHWTGKTNEKHHLSKPVLQYTIDNKFIKRWPSTMEIQRRGGIGSSRVSRCCRGELKQTGGFIFKYEGGVLLK